MSPAHGCQAPRGTQPHGEAAGMWSEEAPHQAGLPDACSPHRNEQRVPRSAVSALRPCAHHPHCAGEDTEAEQGLASKST